MENYSIDQAMKHYRKNKRQLNHQQAIEVKKTILSGDPNGGMEKLRKFQKSRAKSFMRKLENAILASGKYSIKRAIEELEFQWNTEDIEIRMSEKGLQFSFYLYDIMVARLYSDGRFYIFKLPA